MKTAHLLPLICAIVPLHGMCSGLSSHLMDHEGYSSTVYVDTQGHRTIGFGFNLEYYPEAEHMDQDEHILLLSSLAVDAQEEAKRQAGAVWYEWPVEARRVAADMVYNIGPAGWAGFRKCQKAMARCDWDTAAAELMDSRWYHQVGRRGPANVNLLLSCNTLN